jgi:hypothetical protein
MNTYDAVEIKLHVFLTSAVCANKKSVTLTYQTLYPDGKSHRFIRIGGWVGTRTGLDVSEKR